MVKEVVYVCRQMRKASLPAHARTHARTPCDSGVVDQDVHFGLAFSNLRGQRLARSVGPDICRESNRRACGRPEGIEGGHGLRMYKNIIAKVHVSVGTVSRPTCTCTRTSSPKCMSVRGVLIDVHMYKTITAVHVSAGVAS